MASFVFIVDFEEGHLFPTFGLSKSLTIRGHIVHYIGILDNKKIVEEQGFEFHTVLEKQYPAGFIERLKKEHLNKGTYPRFSLVESIEHEVKIILETLAPQGIIINTFLSLEALLIYYRYSIKPIIFTPYLVSHSTPLRECENEFQSLPENRSFEIFQCYKDYNKILRKKKRSFLRLFFNARKRTIDTSDFQDFIAPIENFEEIIACPQEFDLPEDKVRKNAHYIGPCIRNKSTANTNLSNLINKNKKIIYVTLGSQTERIYKVCDDFFLKIIALMRDPEMTDFHIVLSVGSIFKFENAQPLPENITIFEWVESLDVMEISVGTITHGGLGLIKESIFHGLPMIVLPDRYDQPMNAKRVVYHELGIQDNLLTITKENLKTHLQRIDRDQIIKQKVKQMRDIFREKEGLQEGAVLIEKFCNTERSASI